ncbi:LuxR C-terminal-related transcriptional regulator [Streptomyces sp. LE64]|jgi:two-component system, NarL family, response regulator DesR|uniref:LuxR C-terminal-related transcriptional regulator n=1 Tax=Streptomyces sp. LE64 TaxID=3448653 RepID=UPI004041BCBB
MTKVLLVHAVSLWRASLVSLLGKDDGLHVRAEEPAGVATALEESAQDILVTDLDCPDSREVLRVVETLRAPSGRGGAVIALAVLAQRNRTGDLRRAYEAGATGYIDKCGPVDHLCEVVHKVAAGGRHIDESLAFSLLQATDVPLSARELRVLSLAADGESVASIARSLCLASGTVRNYLAAAIRKTGARNRLDAIRLSREFGWL